MEWTVDSIICLNRNFEIYTFNNSWTMLLNWGYFSYISTSTHTPKWEYRLGCLLL